MIVGHFKHLTLFFVQVFVFVTFIIVIIIIIVAIIYSFLFGLFIFDWFIAFVWFLVEIIEQKVEENGIWHGEANRPNWITTRFVPQQLRWVDESHAKLDLWKRAIRWIIWFWIFRFWNSVYLFCFCFYFCFWQIIHITNPIDKFKDQMSISFGVSVGDLGNQTKFSWWAFLQKCCFYLKHLIESSKWPNLEIYYVNTCVRTRDTNNLFMLFLFWSCQRLVSGALKVRNMNAIDIALNEQLTICMFVMCFFHQRYLCTFGPKAESK